MISFLLATMPQGQSCIPGHPCDGALSCAGSHDSDLKVFWQHARSVSCFHPCCKTPNEKPFGHQTCCGLAIQSAFGNGGFRTSGCALRQLVTCSMHVWSGRHYLHQENDGLGFGVFFQGRWGSLSHSFAMPSFGLFLEAMGRDMTACANSCLPSKIDPLCVNRGE